MRLMPVSPVFPVKTGGRLNPGNCRELFNIAVKAVGVKRIVFHVDFDTPTPQSFFAGVSM